MLIVKDDHDEERNICAPAPCKERCHTAPAAIQASRCLLAENYHDQELVGHRGIITNMWTARCTAGMMVIINEGTGLLLDRNCMMQSWRHAKTDLEMDLVFAHAHIWDWTLYLETSVPGSATFEAVPRILQHECTCSADVDRAQQVTQREKSRCRPAELHTAHEHVSCQRALLLPAL